MGGNAAGIVLNNGDTLGNSGGEETHTLTVAELPSHNHTSGGSVPNTINSPFEHKSNVPGGQREGTSTSSTTGGDQPLNIMQPYIIMNYIIKY